MTRLLRGAASARGGDGRDGAPADGQPQAGAARPVDAEAEVAAYARRNWPDDDAPEHDVAAVLRILPFRRLWLALGGSSFGDWLGLLATAALAKNLAGGSYTAENFAIAGVFILRLAPAVLLGPLAGAFADRLDRRWTLVLGDVLRGLLFLTIPLVGTLGWLYTATVLIECLALFWMPAKDATVPNLVPHKRLETANQISLVATYGTAPLAAIVYAGMALVTGTLTDFVPWFTLDPISVAIYVNAATFIVSGLVILRLDIPPTPGREQTRESSVLATIVDGWRFVGRTPVVRGLVIGMLGAFGAAGFVVGLSQTFVQDLGAGQAGFGVLFGAVFVGLAAGMWLGPRLLEGFSRRRLFGLSLICAGAFLVALALVPHIVAAVLFTTAIGACGGIAWVTGYTLLGLEVDDEVRGRTFAFLQSAARVVLVLVLAAGPAIAAPIGTHTIQLGPNFSLTYNGAAWVFLLSGVLCLGLGVTAYRQMDDRRGVPLLADLLSAWRARAALRAAAGAVPRRVLPGYLIAFEGGDGAGKSTQARLLSEWLRNEEGHDVLLTREPGATQLGVRLRELLLSADHAVDPRTEALLFAADRADHVAAQVRPAMERGEIVVTDRYADSSIAYQGAGRDLDGDDIANLSQWATDGLLPDLTVLLDIPSEFARVRRASDTVRNGEDRLEALSAEFHERVRTRFLELARAEPARYLVIDATLPREEVQERIRGRVRDLLPLSERKREQLAQRLAEEEAARRRRAEAEAEVLRLDAELRGRHRDESRERDAARRRLREEAERELEEQRGRPTEALPAVHSHGSQPVPVPPPPAPPGTQPLPTQPLDGPTELIDLSGDGVSGRRETRRP
jgi:dTMP kinase